MRKFLFIIIFLLTLSCERRNPNCLIDEHQVERIESYLDFMSISEYDKNYLIVIPLDGCSGCADITMHFSKKCVAEHSIRFILSSSSKKGIQHAIINERLDEKLILMDWSNMAQKLSVTSNNPVLLEFDNGDICQVKALDPSVIDQELKQLKLNLDEGI